MTNNSKLTRADLIQFSRGTENYYRHGLNRNVYFTDAAKYIADEAGAYWLLDMIAISQLHDKRVNRQPFQVWALAVRPDNSATITVEDGNHNLLCTHEIEFTDFPETGIVLWCSNNVIYHPVEH